MSSFGWRARWIDPTTSSATKPRPALSPRRALPRPDRPVVCPSFGFDWLNTCEVHNSDSSLADPGRNSPKRSAGAEPNRTSLARFGQATSVSLAADGTEYNGPERLSGSIKKSKSYLRRRRNKTTGWMRFLPIRRQFMTWRRNAFRRCC